MRAAAAAFLAGHRAARVPHLTDLLVRTIQQQNPGYRAVAVVPLGDLERSCRDNIVRVLELLAATLAAREAERPVPDLERYYDAALQTGARRAEQGLPLDDVLRSFRLGGRLIWEDLVEQARTTDALDADGLRELGTGLWEVVDDTSAQVAASYHATELGLVRADEQRRATLWEGLLTGRATDPAFALEAAHLLDLGIDAPLVVAAVHHPDPTGNFAHRVVLELQHAGIGSTWQRRTEFQVGLLQVGAAEVRTWRGVLGAWPSVRVGLSSVVPGLAHTGTAFREATLALRTLAEAEAGAVTYDERLPDALLLSSPEVALRLVQAWLGPLDALPENEARSLVETLQLWVACGGSATRTAELLPCHRNTVINRIRRVAEVIGRDLGDGPPPLELALALRARGLDPAG